MSYLGAKSGAGVYQAIINAMPPHDTYIETHLGSGAILKNKAPAMRSIGIDLDPHIVNGFKAPYANTDIIRTDAVGFLNGLNITDKTLIYCDPPYMHQTRTSNARYNFEYDDSDHEQLLKTLLSIGDGAFIIISGYRTDLYDEMLTGWNSMDFQAMTRGGVRTESIWFNYNLKEIHWHQFAGKDFTDRQRIKRKSERWAARYRELPKAEQQAVMAALLAEKCITDPM